MSTPSSTSDFEARLERMQRELTLQQKKLNSRTRVTGFLAAVVIVALGVYFYIGYQAFGEIAQPDKLVAVAETLLDDNLVTARQGLEEMIIASAPGWAEDLSLQVQQSMPGAREELEKYVVGQMDELLSQTSTMTEEQFRGFLKDNHEVLERGFQDLAASPKMAEQTMAEVVKALDRQLSRRMQEDAGQLLDTVADMNKKLTKLEKNRNLNPEQALERRILTLVRRMQLETVEPYPLDRPPTPTKPRRTIVPQGEGSSKEEEGDAAPDGDKPAETASSDEQESEGTPDGDEPAAKANEKESKTAPNGDEPAKKGPSKEEESEAAPDGDEPADSDKPAEGAP